LPTQTLTANIITSEINHDNMSNQNLRPNRLAAATAVIVVGALLMAEAVVSIVTGTPLFFQGLNRGFEFLNGAVFVVLGATLLDLSREMV
jgi:peptidoglycan/LPS O-acetylase OafA/YrhL